ncbi:MAG: hypothetical protein MZV65_21120 [Chromatiales bacterium]|nr:hypothetical protein [Chromatiales bacterium]
MPLSIFRQEVQASQASVPPFSQLRALAKTRAVGALADALGAVKEKGVGHPLLPDSALEDGDGPFLAVDRGKAHGS